MIFGWFRNNPRRELIDRLFEVVSEASRAPALYRDHGVPDTVEGRFECLTLHVFLVLRRLKALPGEGPDVAQDLIDALFRHLDLSLRNLGVADLSVGKKVKKLAQSVYARVSAYDAALAAGDADALTQALSRNILGGGSADGLTAYVRAAVAHLEGLDLPAILAATTLYPTPENQGEPA